VPERIHLSPQRSRNARALRILALPIVVVLATGAVAASRTTQPPPAGSVGGLTASASAGPATSTSASIAPGATPTSTAATAPSTAPATAANATYRAPRVFYRGSAARRVVALTFDDGWDADNAQKVVNILLREDIPATFFINAVWVPADPQLWWRVAHHPGFVIGNHTYLHGDATEMTGAELFRDLQRNARVWRNATGKAMAALFRPPFGYRNASTDQTAARAGFPDVVLWDAPSDDTFPLSDAQVLRNATAGRAGSIVLMHMGPDVTPRILGRVIADYRARGFTFVTVPQLLPPLPPEPPPPPAPTPEPVAVREPEILLHGIS
jgi:peptidoglycan/xylan/chitin deacetylase (PgdA/CDA1 family)